MDALNKKTNIRNNKNKYASLFDPHKQERSGFWFDPHNNSLANNLVKQVCFGFDLDHAHCVSSKRTQIKKALHGVYWVHFSVAPFRDVGNHSHVIFILKAVEVLGVLGGLKVEDYVSKGMAPRFIE